MVDLAIINTTMSKMRQHLSDHNSICVSVSGGGDSDIVVHIISTYFREFLDKVRFVFCNTGLEYSATVKHIDYLENKYNITIDRVRGQSVVSAIRQYGVPVISKEFSKDVHYFIEGSKWAEDKVYGTRLKGKSLSPKQRDFAIALKDVGLQISYRCCDVSKKKPLFEYYNKYGCDLSVTGERLLEHGQRGTAHHDCFEKAKQHKWDKYMPLFFWNDETKEAFKNQEGITFSDCYEVWGMKRTGCVGCPFNSKVGEDLLIIKEFEPGVYKACLNLFGASYILADNSGIRKTRIPPEIMSDLKDIYGDIYDQI